MPASISTVAHTAPGQGPWTLAVFDLDGTLVDTRRDLLEGLEDALGPELLNEESREHATAALHLGMRAMVIAALGESANDIERVTFYSERYSNAYAARIARHSQPYPEVIETLLWLKVRGVRLALCSNKANHLSRLLLRVLNLWAFFPVIVGPDSTGHAKPSPEPLRHAALESGVPLSETVLIGDSSIDLECAQHAGTDCWIFTGGYEPAAAARAPLFFNGFDELRQSACWTESNVPPQRSTQ